jgi:hypothetical protein
VWIQFSPGESPFMEIAKAIIAIVVYLLYLLIGC